MMEKIHIWLGVFGSDAPKDYFTEVYHDDDDKPISRFVGEQGEAWVDHDWMEHSWLDSPVPLKKLIAGHSYSSGYIEELIAAAEAMDLHEANVFVMLDVGEINSPRSIFNEAYTLYYLGVYEDIIKEPPSTESLTQKAEQGCSRSQAILGERYIFPPPGNGLEVDLEKSEYWLLKAAEQGETSVYNRLYHIYYSQSESLHDLEKAFFWIKKAAQQGWGADQSYLAAMYEKGEGVEQSHVDAMKWHFLSACQRSDDSIDGTLNELKSEMTKEELKKAERLAMEWVDKYGEKQKLFLGMVRNPLSNENR